VKSVERHELARLWLHPAYRRNPNAFNSEANVPHTFSVVKPHTLEFVDRHRPVASGRVCEQQAIPSPYTPFLSQASGRENPMRCKKFEMG
jgi:hypothetical protein